MAGRWGRADFRQLQQLERQLDKLERADFARFCREAAKELAQRLLAKVVKRTPVGDYPQSLGKKGGTLRRGWIAQSHDEAVNGKGAPNAEQIRTYVNSLPINQTGNMLTIEIINPVKYAPYVEYGHRTANGKGWVRGHFMLTISAQEVENLAPGLLEKRLYELLKGLF